MATTTTNKRKPLTTHLTQAKPALGDLGGAMTGGLLGAVAPGWASGIGGLLLLGAGAYFQKSWVTSTGAAMLVTNVSTATVSQRSAPGGKFDLQTELYNGKQKGKAFVQDITDKFRFGGKKSLPAADLDEENLDGLGTLDRSHLTALDELNHRLVSDGLRNAGKSFPMVHPGLHVPSGIY